MESCATQWSPDTTPRGRRVHSRVALAAVALLGWSVGWTQQQAPPPAPSGGLDEIVVTAEKRTESLQNVPLSVEALTSDELVRRGIDSVASLMDGDVPSLRVEPFGGNQTVLVVGMRGFINANGTDITNENPVPTYIDDVYYGRQTSLALELNDLERMEILRGPQGTLFGKNAEGGAIRMISKEPTGKFDINASFEGGNYGFKKGTAHIDLPAVANIAAKVDLLGSDSNGWTTNPAPGQHNYGVTESAAAKLTLLWKPSDSVKVEYAGDYTNLWSTEFWNAQLNYSPTGSPYSSVWPNQTTTPLSEPWDTYRPLDPQTYWGNRLTADWAINDSINVKSITALRADKSILYNTAATSAAVPGPLFSPGFFTPTSPNFFHCILGPTLCSGVLTGPIPIFDITHRQVSEEFQLTGKTDHWDWVAGLFYIKETGQQNEITYFGTVLPNSIPAAYPFLPVTPKTSALILPLFGPVSTAGADIDDSSKAAFGQATYRPPGFDNKLSLTAGLRVGHDDKSAVRPADGGDVWLTVTYPPFPSGPIPNGLPCPQTPQCSPSTNKTETSPMAAISYNWTPDLTTYFRYSTGYQAAGLSVGSQIFTFVQPSTVNALEVGLKSEFDEHKVRVNVAAFYETWKDPQENIQTTSPSTTEFFSGPNIYISGLELDSAYAPMPGLTFNASVSLLHGAQATATNPFPPPSGFPPVTAAFKLVQVPSWAGSFAVNYDIAHTDYGVWRTNFQVNGTANYYSVPNVNTPIEHYWLVNGRFGLAEIPLGAHGGKLEINAWVNNLLNKSYNVFIYEIQGPNTDGAFGPPRMWGGSVNYRFN